MIRCLQKSILFVNNINSAITIVHYLTKYICKKIKQKKTQLVIHAESF